MASQAGRLGRAAALAVWALMAGSTLAHAQGVERRIVPAPQADYFGHDYDILRDVDADICETACLADAQCQTFTLNQSSGWCFLKNAVGELRATPGAMSGRIVEGPVANPADDRAREAELAFLPRQVLDDGRRLRLEIQDEPTGATADPAAARQALDSRDYASAISLYREILRHDTSSADAWAGLAGAAVAFDPADWQQSQDVQALRQPAAVSAYVAAAAPAQRAMALDLLAQAYGKDGDWRTAIRVWRAALLLDDAADIRRRLDAAVAEHGFRIVGNSVDNNAASPRICLDFSEDLSARLVGSETVGDFVSVDGGDDFPVSVSGAQMCIDGVSHGQRYRVVVRPGIESASGEVLARRVESNIYVRDRDPAAHFSGNAYVLPSGGDVSVPVTTVNTTTLKARLLRIGDRQLARTLGESRFLTQLSTYELDEIAANTGEEVWTGTIGVADRTNEEVVTAIPLGDIVSQTLPGIYILSAAPENQRAEGAAIASQWFVLTDIGLASFSGADGLHVYARSLGSAEPLAGVSLEVIAANNEVLGRATTDNAGQALFAPGLLAGDGGDRPAVLAASRPDAGGDFVFLDMTAAPFDLADRGVAGRVPAGPLDIFITPDRGIYRPGDTVNLTALVRDASAQAAGPLTLTARVTRPDGVEYLRRAVTAQDAGGMAQNFDLPAGAMRGQWRFALHVDPAKPAIAATTVQVQDFEPQKIDFDLQPLAVLDPALPPDLTVDVRYLFGAPAAGLAVGGEIVLTPAAAIAGYEGYRFGMADDEPTPLRLPFDEVTTDEDGTAVVAIAPFEAPGTTRPLSAELNLRVTDAGGRPVERSIAVPLAGETTRIGIRPLFDGAAPEGGPAAFSVIALGADGQPVDLPGARWVLNRVTTNFQWYMTAGRWNYEPVRRSERVADGVIDLQAGSPANLSLPVEWGGYELAVDAAGADALPASVAFDAGWYVATRAADTPEIARVSLDKPRYAIGDEAVVHIEPRFAGKAQVLVMGDRVIASQMVDLPAEGGEIRLPVTRDWGTGAYVTATIFRPMDLSEKRMPGRAIGLAHAAIDPGDRLLAVRLDAPATMLPRRGLDVPIAVTGGQAGETAFVTLAAVDAGILNITGFEPPAPSDYYFGQRRLGVEIRDLYGRLIDRMQGAPGSVRSGGDAGADIISPPPMDRLVSLFSGVVRLDPQGRAVVPLDVPDFNGTLRLMAVAWSPTGVGEAHGDVIVRDPVVADIIRPRHLAPGDTSRIAVDVTHVEGPSGPVRLRLSGGEGILALDGDDAAELTLGEGERKRWMVPVLAGSSGDAAMLLTLTTPGGETIEKEFTLPVRPMRPETVEQSRLSLAAGASLTLGPDILADFAAGSASATVSITGLGGVDAAGVVRALDRYPYGCTEQLTSRALPLVYLDGGIVAAGLGHADDVRPRVEEAIRGVLANQGSGGSFGLWGPDYGDLWLDAYVTDFLTRAREAGYAVPQEALSLALDNLANQVAYLPEKPDWAPAAYAYYTLARAGRAAIGDLRFAADNALADFPTPMAKAQLAAALGIYGDRVRAESTYRAAATDALAGGAANPARTDYGSPLRDTAAVVTLGLEGDIPGTELTPLVQRLAQEWGDRRHTSTQEDAWSLLAVNALLTDRAPRLTVDGAAVEGPFAASFDTGALQAPVTIANRDDFAADAAITLRGIPQFPVPAASEGYAISRSYYTLDGAEADASAVAMGDRLVAVLDILPVDDGAARLIIDDPLPAGLEIDNPVMLRGGDVAALDFLDLTDQVDHTEFRADRFIVALDKAAGNRDAMRFAYVVRAVSPGEFMHPAATVEDMYRPERRGQTAETRLDVVGPLR